MIERLRYKATVGDTDLLDLVADKLNEVIDELNKRAEYYFAGNPEYAKESAKREETLDPYGYGRCEIPVGYAVMRTMMREKQAVADYKKRLIKKLKLELGRSTLLAGEQDYVIETIEETE